jgi:hypothetical protein
VDHHALHMGTGSWFIEWAYCTKYSEPSHYGTVQSGSLFAYRYSLWKNTAHMGKKLCAMQNMCIMHQTEKKERMHHSGMDLNILQVQTVWSVIVLHCLLFGVYLRERVVEIQNCGWVQKLYLSIMQIFCKCLMCCIYHSSDVYDRVIRFEKLKNGTPLPVMFNLWQMISPILF